MQLKQHGPCQAEVRCRQFEALTPHSTTFPVAWPSLTFRSIGRTPNWFANRHSPRRHCVLRRKLHTVKSDSNVFTFRLQSFKQRSRRRQTSPPPRNNATRRASQTNRFSSQLRASRYRSGRGWHGATVYYVKTWRHTQNRKYIAYYTVVGGGPTGNMFRKFPWNLNTRFFETSEQSDRHTKNPTHIQADMFAEVMIKRQVYIVFLTHSVYNSIMSLVQLE